MDTSYSFKLGSESWLEEQAPKTLFHKSAVSVSSTFKDFQTVYEGMLMYCELWPKVFKIE